MFYAKSDTGERISAERAVEEGIRAGLSCPVCDFPVVLRNGTQRICHFAHRKGADCDSFTADMSEWHLDWQKRFPEECREIVLEGQNELGDIEKHRADVLYHDVVVEFQHSPISEIEFWRRNYFYTRVAKHLLWVFTPSGWISGWKGDWDNNPLDVSLSWDKPSGPFRRFVPQKEPRITIGLQYPPVLNEWTPGWGLSNGNSGADAPWPVAEGAEYDHPFKSFKIRLTSKEERDCLENNDLAGWIDRFLLPRLNEGGVSPPPDIPEEVLQKIRQHAGLEAKPDKEKDRDTNSSDSSPEQSTVLSVPSPWPPVVAPPPPSSVEYPADRCPQCGAPMVLRVKDRGSIWTQINDAQSLHPWDGTPFWGCSQYARTRCRGARPATPPACPLCGKPMAARRRKKDGEPFWGCSDYPNCHGTRPAVLAKEPTTHE